MKNLFLVFAIVLSIVPGTSFAYIVNINLPDEVSNNLGLAVGPNGNVYLTTLSYGGYDNLWEFNTSGVLQNSTRVPIDTGFAGNLADIDFMDNGKIISYVAVETGPSTYERYIYTYNADGSSPSQLFTLPSSMNGLSCASPGILFLSSSEPTLYQGEIKSYINLFTVDGVFISRFLARYNKHIAGIAYDPDSESLFVTYLYTPEPFLEEYVKDENGDYKFSQAYDLSNVMVHSAMAFNFNDGLFYGAWSNQSFSVFSLDDLTKIDPPELILSPYHGLPIPGSLVLLASGLVGLAGLRKKFRS